MKIEEIMKKIEGNISMGVKKFAVSGALVAGLLAGCGRTVDTNQTTTPAPTTSIETTVDNPEVDAPVIDETNPGEVTDKPGTTVAATSAIENPTFVQTGDNEYTIYVDCPDNSNAPELSFISEHDDTGSLEAGSSRFGVSTNLLNAVMTHGMQVNPLDAAQINYDAYLDRPFEFNQLHFGTRTYVLTANPSNYDNGEVWYDVNDLKYNDPTLVSPFQYEVCAILLKDAIVNTNGNITCGLARYNMGPEAWDQAMKECMDATGLTAEEIYAAGDAYFVLSYDTKGLGDPNYVTEVLSYIGPDEPIVITEIDEYGDRLPSNTYIIEEAKAYGQR